MSFTKHHAMKTY